MRIDIHHHIVPPRYLDAVRDSIIHTTPRPELITSWTPKTSIAMLDAVEVDTAFTSVSAPGLWFGDRAQTRDLAMYCNDFAAGMVANHPGRFGMFAMLPLPDIDATLQEISRAGDTLNADGYGLFTNYGDTWLNDPAYDPVLAELDRRKAVCFVHPLAPTACAWMAGLRPSVIEFLIDTLRCMTGLIFSGAAKKYPDIQWIFCHSGGALAPMFERIARQGAHDPQIHARLPEGPLPYFQRFHYDIATSASPDNLGVLLRHVPVTQALFGLDMPFVDATPTLPNFGRNDFNDDQTHAIEYGNALRLFPRLAKI